MAFKSNKKKIKLFRAVALKNELEERITAIDALRTKYNQANKQGKFMFDLETLSKERERKSELLLDLHVLLAEANLKKAKGEKKSNAFHIKKLSELKRQERFYSHVNDHERENSTVAISVAEANKELQRIKQDISTLETKLTTFNNSIDIEIEIPEGLDIVLE